MWHTAVVCSILICALFVHIACLHVHVHVHVPVHVRSRSRSLLALRLLSVPASAGRRKTGNGLPLWASPQNTEVSPKTKKSRTTSDAGSGKPTGPTQAAKKLATSGTSSGASGASGATSFEDFQVEIQAMRRINATRKIMTSIASRHDGGLLTDDMAMLGFKTLQRMGRIDLSLEIVPMWLSAFNGSLVNETSIDPELVGNRDFNSTINVTKLLIRECSKQGRLDLCETVMSVVFGLRFISISANSLSQLEPKLLARKPSSNKISQIVVMPSHPTHATPLKVLRQLPEASQHLAVFQIFADLALGYYFTRRYDKGLATLQYLSTLRLDYHGFCFFENSGGTGAAASSGSADDSMAMQLLKWSLKEAPHEVIMDTIDRLLAIDCLSAYEASQMIASNYMKELTFVKGAVSMETLTPGDRPEIAFIGRSNVGKSSLINMVCNRKKLAFTSKTPGKTSEFNYFAASGVVGSQAQNISYYLVDLPGVGFAEATFALRQSWLSLLNEYAHQRQSLRVLYHLVDSRHGFLDADEECLSLLETLPEHVNYVIVLTKVDKIGAKGVSPYVLDKIQKELQLRTNRSISIIETSSDDKRGGVALWATLLSGISQ